MPSSAIAFIPWYDWKVSDWFDKSKISNLWLFNKDSAIYEQPLFPILFLLKFNAINSENTFEHLKSNNFDKYRPKIILIEILGSTIEEIANGEISKFLKTYNYFFYARSVRTAFFVYDENV